MLQTCSTLSIINVSIECVSLFSIPNIDTLSLIHMKKMKKSHSGKLSLDSRYKIESSSSNNRIQISDINTNMNGTISAKNILGNNERLKGFISSIDVRDQKNFFFFQPVVAAEELECPSYPYLPPLQDKETYTLVLDLDETLIHYQESTKQVLLRPNVQAFINGLYNHYEIVIFTAAVKRVYMYIMN